MCPYSVLRSLKEDCDSWLPSAFLDQDFTYLIKRYECEGDTFLVSTLPLLGKEIERSLSSGTAFAAPKGWPLDVDGLPIIFNEYFKRVFGDDRLPLSPTRESYYAVMILRQVLLFWSKTEQSSTKLYDNAKKDFLQRVSQKRGTIIQSLNGLHSGFLSESKRVLNLVFREQTPALKRLLEFTSEPWGRHGPGAVASKESALEKWDFVRFPHLPDRLLHWSGNDGLTYPKGQNPSSRVTCVPKDFRGPRVICIEPKEFQFGQQGLMEILFDIAMTNSLSRRSINFFNVNRSKELCYNNSYATIDLKDASDRLTLEMVKLIFPRWVYKILVRFRTPMVEGQRYSCFSTMGSALCFPVQTLAFWALALGALIDFRDRQGDRPQRLYLRVFGDDIIVPTWGAEAVCSALTACGLVINPNKTCISSFVRESCGEWVYAGLSARIVKPRYHGSLSYSAFSRYLDTAKELNEIGFLSLSKYVKSLALNFYTPVKRWCKRYQRQEIRVPLLVETRRPRLTGFPALYAWNFRGNTSPSSRGTRRRVKWVWIKQDTKFLP